ncbi:MAG: hypothetical protein RBS11_07030 [Sulfurimonas sp.]|nr:hypothetical protein [Sulfurimonas sp.]
MNIIEIYTGEIEVELNLVHTKLAELKAKVRSLSDTQRLNSFENVQELEDIANDMVSKVKELQKDMEDSWKQIQDDVQSSHDTVDDAFARLNRSLA